MKKINSIFIVSMLVLLVGVGTAHAGSSFRRPRRVRLSYSSMVNVLRTQYILQTLCTILQSNNLEHELCNLQEQEPYVEPPIQESPVDISATVNSEVVISEIYYDVATNRGGIDDEWVELYNFGDDSVDISGWKIGDNDGQLDILPENTVLSSGSFLLISRNVNTFTDFWSTEVPDGTQIIGIDSKIGSNGLSSTGDTVILQDAEGSMVDSMSYGSESEASVRAFEPGADDVVKGHSLSRDGIGTDTDTAVDWSDLETPTPGM